MKRRLAAMTLLVLALASSACSDATVSMQGLPSPTYTTQGALRPSADGTLVLTGTAHHFHIPEPGVVDEIALDVPASIDGITVPITLILTVDDTTRVLDDSGGVVERSQQEQFLARYGVLTASVRRDGDRLIATHVRRDSTLALKATRANPPIVVHGLLSFDSDGVAQLGGEAMGWSSDRSGRLDATSLDVGLLFDELEGRVRFTLLVDRDSKILNASGADVPLSRADTYVRKAVVADAVATVRESNDRAGHLIVVTFQVPVRSTAAQ